MCNFHLKIICLRVPIICKIFKPLTHKKICNIQILYAVNTNNPDTFHFLRIKKNPFIVLFL